MDETKVVSTKAVDFYKMLLLFYPAGYRKYFGEEMVITFEDMQKEQLEKFGKLGFLFWFSVFIDVIQSAIKEHMELIRKQGLRKYFHITIFNIIGGILLLPFVTLAGIDIVGRIVQRDFVHYNRAFYAVVSRSFLYSNLQLLWAVMVFFPMLAVLITLIPLLISFSKNKRSSLYSFLFSNFLGIGILGLGLFALLVVFGHDFIPCFVRGILSHGFGSLNSLLPICRNA